MRVFLFGASGGTGTALLTRLLTTTSASSAAAADGSAASAGAGGAAVRHTVTAVVRSEKWWSEYALPAGAASSEAAVVEEGVVRKLGGLTLIRADVFDVSVWSKYLAGHDVVINAMGSRNTKAGGIYSAANAAIVKAMQEAGVRRLVTVTADHDREDAPFFFKHVLRKVILPDIFEDIKKFETEMRGNTSVDWTIVRPQRLNDDKTEDFIFRVDGPVKHKSGSISRAGLARFIVEEGVKPEYIHKLVSIASS